MSNAVGKKAQKCRTSQVLDELFEDGNQVGQFSIPVLESNILRAQVSGAAAIGTYEPLPGHTVAESLVAGVSGYDGADRDTLTFTPCGENGWTSERQEIGS